MERSGPLFDLYLRTGFFRPPGMPPMNWLGTAAGLAEIHRYPIEDPVSGLLDRVGRGTAPYIVFADDAVRIPHEDLLAVYKLLARNRTLPALTFECGALTTVFGVSWDEKRLDTVRRSFRKLDHLPPWFCILNRELTAGCLNLDAGHETLEFFLLGAARRLREKGLQILCTDGTLVLDARYWVRDLVERNVSRLAADYSRHQSSPDAREVPPQFRVELLGEYAATDFEGTPSPSPSAGRAPLFSVICPAYKSPFFEPMLRSVLEQTWSDWELVVLVDGPPEEDLKRLTGILERYGQDRRLRWATQENQGTGPTRRRLVEMARGRYVLSIDDDDMLFPDTLEIFAAVIERHPEVGVFRGGGQLMGLVNRYLLPRQRVLIGGVSVDTFEVTQPFVLKRDTLARLGNFEGDDAIGGAGEDTDLFLKIDRAKLPTIIVNRPLYYRRLSTYNQSLSFVFDHALGHLETIDRRFTPSGWRVCDRIDQDEGSFTSSILVYTQLSDGLQVVAPTRYFSYQTVGDPHLKTIDLEITSVCNAVCPFCPREVLAGKNNHMSLEMVHALAANLREERSARKIVLCGIGEPTLHPHLEDIVQILSETGAEVCMTTNGARIDGDRFEQLVERGLKEINFSLNAATPETHRRVMELNYFDTVVANLGEILQHRLPRHPEMRVHVSFVLCSLNQHEARDFVERWRQTPVTQVWLHPVNNRAGLLSSKVEPVDLRPFAMLYDRDPKVTIDLFRHDPEAGNVCTVAQNIDFISFDGSLRLCALDYTRQNFFGNLQYASLKEMHLDKMLRYLRGETLETCSGCDFCPRTGPARALSAAPPSVERSVAQ